MKKDVIHVSCWKFGRITVRIFRNDVREGERNAPRRGGITNGLNGKKTRVAVSKEFIDKYFKGEASKQEIENTIINAARFFLNSKIRK